MSAENPLHDLASIGLVMIVRDEEQVIERCLNSVKPLVYEI